MCFFFFFLFFFRSLACLLSCGEEVDPSPLPAQPPAPLTPPPHPFPSCPPSWEEVTPERARFVYDAFINHHWSYERLYLGWWQRLIYEHRPGLIKSKRLEVWPKPAAR